MVAFKTQQGEKYGNNIKCKVNLKVISEKTFPYLYKKLDLIILLGHEKRFIVLSQKTSSCPSLVVSCPKFDIAHKNPNCKGKHGDFLSLGNKRFGAVIFTTRQFSCHIPLRFCQNSGPKDFISNSKKLTVTFNSNKKVEGQGADCIVACSDFIPTGK